jgi:hypothetical protein
MPEQIADHEAEPETTYRVVTSRVAPTFKSDSPPVDCDEENLTLKELSTQYPRSRSEEHSGFGLASYDGVDQGEGGESEEYTERIEPAKEGDALTEDPRMFDDELDLSELPEGYVVGEGYLKWKQRTHDYGTVRYYPPEYLDNQSGHVAPE